IFGITGFNGSRIRVQYTSNPELDSSSANKSLPVREVVYNVHAEVIEPVQPAAGRLSMYPTVAGSPVLRFWPLTLNFVDSQLLALRPPLSQLMDRYGGSWHRLAADFCVGCLLICANTKSHFVRLDIVVDARQDGGASSDQADLSTLDIITTETLLVPRKAPQRIFVPRDQLMRPIPGAEVAIHSEDDNGDKAKGNANFW
ncbi:hypothetical protein EV182_007760, partial [Spiromyces aspiralis]